MSTLDLRAVELAAGEVHVWRAELEQIDERRALALLYAGEYTRWARILDHGRASLWACSRALLRELIGRYLLEDPRALRFSSNPHGKPALAGDDRPLRFSVSHSGALALYAFAREREVGVDVQTRVPSGNVLGVARRAFGAEAATRIAGLPPTARRSAFLSAWVRHEAELKCSGDGLGRTSGRRRRGLWTVELPCGGGDAAALAAERAPHVVLYRNVDACASGLHRQ
jgi:4'-phosphopantetheinyl transferase